MLENIKAVNNPLTIIAIFAALAEIAGTVAIKLVSPELQHIFIWFVVVFPILIVILFFLTLNFNPTVLYAPSDFKDEENFLNTPEAKQISASLEEVTNQVETAKKQITESLLKHYADASEKGRKELEDIISSRMATVQNSIENTKESVQTVAAPFQQTIDSRMANEILKCLNGAEEGLTAKQLAEKFGKDFYTIYRQLNILRQFQFIARRNGKHFLTPLGKLRAEDYLMNRRPFSS